MNAKLKSLTAALTLVAAGGAQAVIETGENSPGNLILQILSEDGLNSAVLDIDLTIDQVRAGEVSYSFDVRGALGDAAFDTLTAGDFTWAVVGGSLGVNEDFGLVSTAAGGLPNCDRDNCQVPTATALLEFMTAADAASPDDGISPVLDSSAGQAFAGQLRANFQSNAGYSPFITGEFKPGGFGQADLYDIGVNPSSFETEIFEAPNLALLRPNGEFFIGVPVPAAVWLFGSALAGLAAAGRRRT